MVSEKSLAWGRSDNVIRVLTAYGLANPLLLIIGAVGSMLCAGAQVACSK